MNDEQNEVFEFAKPIEIYFERIKTKYESSKESEREKILRGLDKILQSKEPRFDGRIAEEFRSQSIVSLARQLDISANTIRYYEKMGRKSGDNRKIALTPINIKYFKWLRERGYNPLNLKENSTECSTIN